MIYDWQPAVSGLNDYVDRLRARHNLGLDNILKKWADGGQAQPNMASDNSIPMPQTEYGIERQSIPQPQPNFGDVLRSTVGNAGAGFIDALANGDFNGNGNARVPETQWLAAARPHVSQPQQLQPFQPTVRRMPVGVPNLLTRYMG